MASNGEESEFFYGIKNNASIANATPTLIVTKNADGTYEHATVANIPLSSAAIAGLALKADLLGDQTFGAGEKTFSDVVNLSDVVVSGTAQGQVATLSNQFVVKSQLDLKANAANPTFTGVVNLQANTIGSQSRYIGQLMADNDFWRLYGDFTTTDEGVMVFEVGDNAAPVAGSGQRFEFRYSSDGGGGSAKKPWIIDYNLNTSDASILIKTSTDSLNPFFLKIEDLAGTGDRSALIEPDGKIKAGLAVPKVYNALLSQSALLAPVATIVSNTLSGTPAWAYVSPGQYTLTLANAFPLGKTLIFSLIGSGTAAGDTSIKCFRNSDSEIVLNTTFNAAFTNILLTNASFKIEVYP